LVHGGDACVSGPDGGDNWFRGRERAGGPLRGRDVGRWTTYDGSGGGCGDDSIGCATFADGGRERRRPRAGRGGGPSSTRTPPVRGGGLRGDVVAAAALPERDWTVAVAASATMKVATRRQQGTRRRPARWPAAAAIGAHPRRLPWTTSPLAALLLPCGRRRPAAGGRHRRADCRLHRGASGRHG